MAGNRQDDSAGADAVRFTPPNPLKNAVRDVRPGEASDPVARAEQALAALANEFPAWMRSECARLDKARRAFIAAPAEATKTDLYMAAHDIKGEAGTFGFPQAALVADSLCRLLEHSPTLSRIPLTLVDQHVQRAEEVLDRAGAAEVAVGQVQQGLPQRGGLVRRLPQEALLVRAS